MANPKGNLENLKLGHFKTDRSESCTAQINVRIPPSLKEKLKGKKGWHEGIREYLEKFVEMESA